MSCSSVCAADEFGSLLDGTNGVLPGLTDFVSQM